MPTIGRADPMPGRCRHSPDLTRKRLAALATIPIITSGCAGLPAASDVSSMTFNTTGAMSYPVASVVGESDMGPGKAAMAVIPPSGACTDIMAIVCAIFIPLAVPIAAVVGATVKTTQKLPSEQAIGLNLATQAVARPLNLTGSFEAAMLAEAQLRGITLNAANADAHVTIEFQRLAWDIRSGNRVAIELDIGVMLRRGDQRGSIDLTYRGDAAKVKYWIADGGRPIRDSLEEVMASASRAAWNRILDAN